MEVSFKHILELTSLIAGLIIGTVLLVIFILMIAKLIRRRRWCPFYCPPLCACTCRNERNLDYGVARTASFTFRRNRPFVATRFANLKSGLRNYVVSDGQNNLVNSKKNNENSYMTAEEYANNSHRKYGTSDDYSTYKARNNHYGDYTYSGDYEFEDQIESEVK